MEDRWNQATKIYQLKAGEVVMPFGPAKGIYARDEGVLTFIDGDGEKWSFPCGPNLKLHGSMETGCVFTARKIVALVPEKTTAKNLYALY